jgi:hypothetical protein
MQENPKINNLRKLSVLMDSKYSGPFGFKFGLDGLIGLIPFVGDFISTGISFYIVFQAAMMGCSPEIILRMGLNILIDNLSDMFPVLGQLFDFIWKSNNKNIQLIEEHLENPRSATLKTRLTLGLVAFTLLGVLIGSIAFTVFIFKTIFEWIALSAS